MTRHVKVVEVGPRDGLQNIADTITTDQKLEFIRRLVSAGCRTVEATSFVSPRAIPQLADADELYPQLPLQDLVVYPALVPNMRGMERALAAGVREIALFTAASDSFNRENIKASIDESFERFTPVCDVAHQNNIRIRGYISTAFVCPYEGRILLRDVENVCARLFDLGVYEISLGDTIGAAAPRDVDDLLNWLVKKWSVSTFALHMHDTRGTALANVLAGLTDGIRTFDSSAGGLGGCPFAPGASGNLATEDLVYMLENSAFRTDIDLQRLCGASLYMESVLGYELPSRYLAYYKSTLEDKE